MAFLSIFQSFNYFMDILKKKHTFMMCFDALWREGGRIHEMKVALLSFPMFIDCAADKAFIRSEMWVHIKLSARLEKGQMWLKSCSYLCVWWIKCHMFKIRTCSKMSHKGSEHLLLKLWGVGIEELLKAPSSHQARAILSATTKINLSEFEHLIEKLTEEKQDCPDSLSHTAF